MTKRTRLFFLVAGGILAAGLGTGLIASYMGVQGLGLLGRDGPAELAYVPSDARMLAFANVRHVMTSDLRQALGDLRPGAEQGAGRFEQETGIDVDTDIDHVVMAVAGDASAAPNERPLVLARGRFNASLIETLLREHGAELAEHRGVRVMTHEDEGMAVGFLEPGLVAIGTPAAVRGAIDTEAGGAGVRDNDEVMRLVRDVDDGNAWAVARFDALTGTSRLPADLAGQLPPIGWFSATGYVNGGVRGELRAEARDETSAEDLRQVIRGFLALARMQMSQQAELAGLVDSLQLGGQGRTVSLSFSVPTDLLRTLGAMRPRLPEATPPAADPAGQTVPAL